MVFRVRRRARKISRVLVPTLPIERLMWVIWVPVIFTWMGYPFVAIAQDPVTHPWIAVPLVARSSDQLFLVRWIASGLGLVCLLFSIRCWVHMGRDWRMGVDPTLRQRLITDGLFSWVRHPIYAFSVALMSLSVVAVPTVIMLAAAVIHITLMSIKADNEEAFLAEVHGVDYLRYCARTGRFVPRWRRIFGVVSSDRA